MAQFKKLEILPKLVDKQVMHFPGPRFEISPRAKKVKFQHLLPLPTFSVTGKGNFLKFWATHFLTIVGPNVL